MDPRVNYCTPFFVAAIFIFSVALFAYPRRRVRGGWYLILACLAAAVWAATEGLLYLGLDLETNMFITYMQYLGVAPLPPLVLLFVLSVFGFNAWLSRFKIALLYIIAAIIIVLVWANPLHRLVFVDYYIISSGPFPMIGLEHGPLWWIIIGYHYILLAVLSLILLQQVLTSSGFHSSQAGVILIAVVIVWIINAVYISGNSPVPNMDIGPIAFVLVAASMTWGFFRYNLLDIAPIAKTEIFSGLKDPILVLDQQNRIVDINQAAGSLFRIDVHTSIGRKIGQVLGGYSRVFEVPEENKPLEIGLTLEGRERFFELRISVLSDRRGLKLGRVIVLHDTTELKYTAEALCKTEKQQGVSEMAGAVCHELNQPLMAILGYSELLAMKVNTDDPLYPDIVKIIKQVETMGRITHKLMSITRYETKEYLDRKIIDLEKSSPTTKPDS